MKSEPLFNLTNLAVIYNITYWAKKTNKSDNIYTLFSWIYVPVTKIIRFLFKRQQEMILSWNNFLKVYDSVLSYIPNDFCFFIKKK